MLSNRLYYEKMCNQLCTHTVVTHTNKDTKGHILLCQKSECQKYASSDQWNLPTQILLAGHCCNHYLKIHTIQPPIQMHQHNHLWFNNKLYLAGSEFAILPWEVGALKRQSIAFVASNASVQIRGLRITLTALLAGLHYTHHHPKVYIHLAHGTNVTPSGSTISCTEQDLNWRYCHGR